MQKMLCSALNSLIEECTVILGWCYTSAEVEDTKRRQRALMAEAMEAAHFDSALCLESWVATGHVDTVERTKISEPLTARAAAAATRVADTAAVLLAAAFFMIMR